MRVDAEVKHGWRNESARSCWNANNACSIRMMADLNDEIRDGSGYFSNLYKHHIRAVLHGPHDIRGFLHFRYREPFGLQPARNAMPGCCFRNYDASGATQTEWR